MADKLSSMAPAACGCPHSICLSSPDSCHIQCVPESTPFSQTRGMWVRCRGCLLSLRPHACALPAAGADASLPHSECPYSPGAHIPQPSPSPEDSPGAWAAAAIPTSVPRTDPAWRQGRAGGPWPGAESGVWPAMATALPTFLPSTHARHSVPVGAPGPQRRPWGRSMNQGPGGAWPGVHRAWPEHLPEQKAPRTHKALGHRGVAWALHWRPAGGGWLGCGRSSGHPHGPGRQSAG